MRGSVVLHESSAYINKLCDFYRKAGSGVSGDTMNVIIQPLPLQRIECFCYSGFHKRVLR